MKSAAFALGLIALAMPLAASADENLVAKREACRQEARARIGLKDKVDVEGYRRIVERRNAHIGQCMTRVFVARKQAPLPPQRALVAALGEPAETLAAPSGKSASKLVKRKERRKVKAVSVRASKGQSLKRKRLKRPLSRSK